MRVKTYRYELARTGLLVGEANARRYFSKRSPCIELRLDDLHIQCTLGADFWKGSPQIHDPRLSEWLEFKAGRRGAGRDSISVTLTPLKPGAFIVRAGTQIDQEAFGAEVSKPRKVHSESRLTFEGAPALEALSVA
jgi:hypothetical protein